MGRKKKIEPAIQAQEQAHKGSATNVGYQGQVKVSIKSGKRTISSKTYKNSGCPLLFEFICKALAGNFIQSARPCKIKLFTRGAGETVSNPNFEKTTSITPFMLYDTTADVAHIESTSTEEEHYTVTYHFRIPYVYIKGTEVYKAALYNMSPDNDHPETNICAYYLFTNSTKTDWEPIKLDDTSVGNFSILIDWAMSVMNNKSN